jgi:hypothetical protein
MVVHQNGLVGQQFHPANTEKGKRDKKQKYYEKTNSESIADL